jgi:hypothetical protein
MPTPATPGLAEGALDAFGGRYVAYVGEWASGMTGTRALHERLLGAFELARQIELPCTPLARVALHLFRRRETESPSPAPPSAAPRTAAGMVGAECVVCGTTLGLRACPWTRTLLLCSEGCHAAAAPQHVAAIAWLCGGAVDARNTRPDFDEFHPGAEGFVDVRTASADERRRLAQATPQPEREAPPYCVWP